MIDRRGLVLGAAAGLAFLSLPVAGVEDGAATQSTREIADDLIAMETAYAMAMTNPDTEFLDA